MAKKTVSQPVAATQKVSKSRKEPDVKIPSAQRYFWDFADKVWEHATTHQVRLAARRPLLSLEFIGVQKALITQVKELPNNDVRTAKKTKSRKSLSAHRQAVVSEANFLYSGIQQAYRNRAELIPVELKEAGITALRKATPRDWAAVSTFLTTCITYLADNGPALVEAGVIAEDFATNLETVGNEFNAAKANYGTNTENAKNGTLGVAGGIKKIKEGLSMVLELGKQVFEFEPDIRKLFTQEYVLDEVRSTHPANIVGRTLLGPIVKGQKNKPVANILVEVLGMEDKSALTNREGSYKIPIAGGDYQLRFSGEGMSPIEMPMTVKPGKDRRISVGMEPMPAPMASKAVVENASGGTASKSVAPPPPATIDDALMAAMKEVAKPAATNGVYVS